MTTIEYLNQVGFLDSRIKNKMLEIEQYRQMIYGLKAIRNGDRVQSSPDFDKIGNNIIRLTEMEAELDKLIDRYTAQKQIIIRQIDSIDNELYYNIIFARHIQNLTFEKIAIKINYSERSVYKVYKKAINDFERRYGKKYLRKSLKKQKSS